MLLHCGARNTHHAAPAQGRQDSTAGGSTRPVGACPDSGLRVVTLRRGATVARSQHRYRRRHLDPLHHPRSAQGVLRNTRGLQAARTAHLPRAPRPGAVVRLQRRLTPLWNRRTESSGCQRMGPSRNRPYRPGQRADLCRLVPTGPAAGGSIGRVAVNEREALAGLRRNVVASGLVIYCLYCFIAGRSLRRMP